MLAANDCESRQTSQHRPDDIAGLHEFADRVQALDGAAQSLRGRADILHLRLAAEGLDDAEDDRGVVQLAPPFTTSTAPPFLTMCSGSGPYFFQSFLA